MSKHFSSCRLSRPYGLALFSFAMALFIALGLTPDAAFCKADHDAAKAVEHIDQEKHTSAEEAQAADAQDTLQATAIADYQDKAAEYTAMAAEHEKKATELTDIIASHQAKAKEHTSAAARLEKKAKGIEATIATHKEKASELAAEAAEHEKKAAELAAIVADHKAEAEEHTSAAAKDEAKAEELAAIAAGHKDKAAELTTLAADLKEKAKAVAEASAAKKSDDTKGMEVLESSITTPAAPIKEGTDVVKLKRGQISRSDLRKIQLAFFGLGLLISAFFLLSPMFLSSYRSVGSPSEIIEVTGLGAQNTKGKKLLLAYDTRHGTTAITAQKMGNMFADKGCQVDVRCLKNIMDEDISGYDAYVVGSWIYYMGISPETVAFLKKFKNQLTIKPTAYFVVCGKLLTGSVEKVGDVVRTYIKKAETEVPEIKPIDLGMFPGGVILSKLSFWERMQMHIKMHKLTKPRMKEGVFINDNMIDEWTTKIVALI